MKFVVGENGRNPVKNLPRPHFVHHETHMEGPRRKLGTPAVGGERLTACATRPHILEINVIYTNCSKNPTFRVNFYSYFCISIDVKLNKLNLEQTSLIYSS